MPRYLAAPCCRHACTQDSHGDSVGAVRVKGGTSTTRPGLRSRYCLYIRGHDGHCGLPSAVQALAECQLQTPLAAGHVGSAGSGAPMRVGAWAGESADPPGTSTCCAIQDTDLHACASRSCSARTESILSSTAAERCWSNLRANIFPEANIGSKSLSTRIAGSSRVGFQSM